MSKPDNILDRAIAYVAPGWAAQRAYARSVLEVNASMRGGVATRTSTPWFKSQSVIGGKPQERWNLASMRDRARRAYSQNYIARSILDAETDYVVGDGFMLKAKTDSKEFNIEAEYEFMEWLDSADIRGMRDGTAMQRDLYSNSRLDGDMGLVLVDKGGASRLQMIPSDLIDSPGGQDDKIVSGVEISKVGRPVAFHVYSAQADRFRQQAQRISAENMKYLAWISDPLGIRGETCFAQVFPLLDQIDGYVDAVVIAARMAAMFGLIFKEATAAKQYSSLPTLNAKASGEIHRRVTIDGNGLLKYIGEEGDVMQVDAKQPMNQTPDFIRAMLRMIGLPFQMPLELIAKDVSQSNLSALRGVRRDYLRACKPRQHRFVWAYLTPVYRWWLSRRVNAGEFVSAVPANYWPHEYIAAKNDKTIEEMQADLLSVDMGTNSIPRLCSEGGVDYEEIATENEVVKKRREDAGLPLLRSTYTRDSVAAPVEAAMNQPSPDDGEDATAEVSDPTANTQKIKAEADAYGVAVRAGAITPQTDDENSFRERMGLPPLSSEAIEAWKKDNGVRRPITLVPTPGTDAPAAQPLQPDEDTDDGEDETETRTSER